MLTNKIFNASALDALQKSTKGFGVFGNYNTGEAVRKLN